MKKHTTTLALCFFSAICGFSQVEKKSVVIGELISKPNAILILNPADDNQGFLLPQVTTANRLSIVPSSPAEDGLMVFDITEKLFYHWKNGQWVNGLGSGVNQTLIYDPTNNTISLSDGNTISLTGVPAGIAGGDLTGDYPNPGVANNAITSAKILDNGITSADILDATITPLDLASNAVTTTKISDGAVTNLKLANTTVTPGSYGAGTQVSQFVVDAQGRITSATNIAITGAAPTGAAGGDLSGTYPNPIVGSNAITSAKILDGTIVSADIQDATISNADLANNAVTTLKIIDGAVTNLKLANTTVIPGSYGTATEVSQITVDAQGRITSAVNIAVPGLTPQTSYYSVDPSDFALVREDNNDNHGAVIFDAENTFVTGDGNNSGEFIMAPLHFPHGAILNQMIIYYRDNSPNSITVSLLRKNLATAASNVMNTWTSSVNTGGILTQTTINFNGMEIIGNDIYSYRLYVVFDFNSNVDNPAEAIQRIYGARIRYQH